VSHKGGLPRGFKVRRTSDYVKELAKERDQSQYMNIEIAKIDFDETQPRKMIQEERLKELAQSIREKGVIEPVIVIRNRDRYRLISGERRVRASILAGLKSVPAILRTGLSDKEIKEIQLIENLQREDITPLERAEAIRDYLSPVVDEKDLPKVLAQMEFSPDELPKEITDTVSVLLKNLGKSLKTLRRWVSLLSLPDEIKEQLRSPDSPITSRHVEELLKIKDITLMKEVAKFIEKEHLSSSQTRDLVKEIKKRGSLKVGYKPFLNYISRIEAYLSALPSSRLKKDQREKIKNDLIRLREKIDQFLTKI